MPTASLLGSRHQILCSCVYVHIHTCAYEWFCHAFKMLLSVDMFLYIMIVLITHTAPLGYTHYIKLHIVIWYVLKSRLLRGHYVANLWYRQTDIIMYISRGGRVVVPNRAWYCIIQHAQQP